MAATFCELKQKESLTETAGWVLTNQILSSLVKRMDLWNNTQERIIPADGLFSIDYREKKDKMEKCTNRICWGGFIGRNACESDEKYIASYVYAEEGDFYNKGLKHLTIFSIVRTNVSVSA